MLNRLIKFWKKNDKVKTALHPEFKRLIEKVATINGRDLWAFKSLMDMPVRRYDWCNRFSIEFQMRVDLGTLKETHETVINDIGMMDGNNLASLKRKSIALLENINRMTELTISMDGYFRLASCVYFWIDEDLTNYDFDIGDEKIRLFKKQNFDDFFLNMPVRDYIPPINLSAHDLEIFSRLEKEIKNIHLQILKKTKLKKITVS